MHIPNIARIAVVLATIATLALPNALSDSSGSSPFVASLRETSVKWVDWQDDPAATAKSQEKPIFFFVGHFGNGLARAMVTETFSNQTIAQSLNETAIAVIVETNTEPELAAFLTQLARDHFGTKDWPLCVWTDASLAPLTGSGYLPPTDDWGGQGFLTVSRNVAEKWETTRQEFQLPAADNLQKTLETAPLDTSVQALEQAVNASDRVQEDAQSLGSTQLLALSRALALLPKQSSEELAQSLAEEIRRISSGAGFDSISGGFFIGANDPDWRLPLFQKSTVDQALMVQTLANLHKANPQDEYLDLMRLTLDFVESHLLKPNKLALQYLDSFAAGETPDAVEGSYYLLDAKEVGRLEPEAAAAWNLSRDGNVDESVDVLGLYQNQNIPYNATQGIFSERFDEHRQALQELRESKSSPATDPISYTATNAMLVKAYLAAREATGDPKLLEKAVSLFEAIRTECQVGDQLANNDQGTEVGSSDAYIETISAAISLFKATDDDEFLTTARALLESMPDPLQPLRGVSELEPKLAESGIRYASQADLASPSALSVQVDNLRQLAALTGDESHTETAKTLLQSTFASVPQNSARYLSLHVSATGL